MAKVQIELPEALIRTANLSLNQLSLDVAKMIALELFREYAVSMGKAAELCGVSVEEFMEDFSRRGFELINGSLIKASFL